jgi:phenylacetic acid degradation operon negative regulatory protein
VGRCRERAAYSAYIPMVTEWRRFPYLDPGLPLELLPEGWPGLVAERLFAELHGLLKAPADLHAHRLMTGEAASTTRPG